MKVDIVTPDGVLFSGEVEAVAVPGIKGEFVILNNHAPIISILEDGNIRLIGEDITIEDELADKFVKEKEEILLPIHSGTVEAKNNQVIILAE
jgi:F-type H+-transporting ATPase subunit epsilon